MANAFDEMNNAAGGDMFITGGSIFNSKYENEMTPGEQSEYENEIYRLFVLSFNRDPLVKQHPVSFNYWLKKQDAEDLTALASAWEDKEHIRKERGIIAQQDEKDFRWEGFHDDFTEEVLAGDLQKLAHLHTGRIEDLIDIVSNLPIVQEHTLGDPTNDIKKRMRR